MLASALRAARRGWRCFPVQRQGKKPLVRWQDQATTDEQQLHDWWTGQWETANVAAVVPALTVVLDIDPRHGGDVTLEQLEAEHGTLPSTLTAITGSGGQHLWFADDDPDRLTQDANVLGPGVDSRCAGRGYLVIPPSVHPCGGRYEWVPGGTRVTTPAPDWLTGRLRKPPVALSLPLTAGSGGTSGYGRRALHDELAQLATSSIGHRNHDLHRAAARLGQLVAAGHLDDHETFFSLLDAGRRVGLADPETTATVRSGMQWGRQHPRATG